MGNECILETRDRTSPTAFLDKNWQTAVKPKYLPFFRRFVNRKYHLVHGLYYSATVKQHPAYYWYHFLTSFVLLDFDPILSTPEYAKIYVPKVWTSQGTGNGVRTMVRGDLLPIDFGRLPLQSYCDDPYSPILMIYGAYERRGVKQGSVVRNKSFVIAFALKDLCKIWKYSKNALWHHLNTHISIKRTRI